MILLSRVIKSNHWSNVDQQVKKVISIKHFREVKQEPENSTLDFNFIEERNRIIEQAKIEANAIISEARTQAASIKVQLDQEKSAWEIELENLKEKAKQVGHEEGLAEGRNQGYQEMREVLEGAKQIVVDSKIDYRNKIESSDQTILDLGLKVAQKILGEHINGQPENFMAIVKRALKEAREYREVSLHVNPIHYGFMLSQKEDLLNIFPKETELYIYPDADLSESSCIIESANGCMDASVDQQLGEIRHKLFELLESE